MHRRLVIAAIGLSAFAGTFSLARYEARRAHVAADVRVVETGIDADGYWFARVEVSNTGTLPWELAAAGRLSLIGNSTPAVELGTNMPLRRPAARFDFLIETVDEVEVPPAAVAVSFDLSVISTEPWFLGKRRSATWSHVLSL